MRIAIIILCVLIFSACASSGPVIVREMPDGSTVKFENKSYTLGPAQLTGADNDFDGAYEVAPDGTVTILVKSGQAIESANSQSPIADLLQLIKLIQNRP